VLASLAAALVDNVAFLLAYRAGASIALSQIIGRVGGVTVNYPMVRGFVFSSRERHRVALPKFFATVVALGFVSYAGIRLLSAELGVPVLAAKIAMEVLIYLGNFVVQRQLVFAARRA
jgi:putative flippase GtrA